MYRSYYSWEEQEANKQGHQDESKHCLDYEHDKYAYDGVDRTYWDGREDEKKAERQREEQRQEEEEQERQERDREEQRQEHMRREEERQREEREDYDRQIQEEDDRDFQIETEREELERLLHNEHIESQEDEQE